MLVAQELGRAKGLQSTHPQVTWAKCHGSICLPRAQGGTEFRASVLEVKRNSGPRPGALAWMFAGASCSGSAQPVPRGRGVTGFSVLLCGTILAFR